MSAIWSIAVTTLLMYSVLTDKCNESLVSQSEVDTFKEIMNVFNIEFSLQEGRSRRA